MEFKNAETAKKFDSDAKRDKKITIPGVYSGMLSDITPEVAQKLVDMEDNQVKPKAATAQNGGTKPSSTQIAPGTDPK